MIRRVAFFKVKDGADPQRVQDLMRFVGEIRAKCGCVQDLALGPAKTNTTADAWTHMWDMQFTGAKEVRAFLDDPWQQREIASRFDATHPASLVEKFDSIYFEPIFTGSKQKGMKEPVRRAMMFRFAAIATPEQIKKTEELVNEMGPQIPAIKSWALGRASKDFPTSYPWTHIREHELEDFEAVDSYAKHPYHIDPIGVHYREMMRTGVMQRLTIAWYKAPHSFIAP